MLCLKIWLFFVAFYLASRASQTKLPNQLILPFQVKFGTLNYTGRGLDIKHCCPLGSHLHLVPHRVVREELRGPGVVGHRRLREEARPPAAFCKGLLDLLQWRRMVRVRLETNGTNVS